VEDGACPLFSPVLNRLGEREGPEKVNVDIDSLSLISIGGFFLGLLGLGILYLIGGFPSFYYPYTLSPY
jgi:hypothetical protein